MLAEGWIKRVLKKITPFEQRIQDYQHTQVNTIVTMLSQAGPRSIGAVPLNSKAVDKSGLIEIYSTILNRGMDLSINAGTQDPGVYAPLLLAAGRLADLYMLLGNEAFAERRRSDHRIWHGRQTVRRAIHLDSRLHEPDAVPARRKPGFVARAGRFAKPERSYLPDL